jgi:hypothetical protein
MPAGCCLVHPAYDRTPDDDRLGGLPVAAVTSAHLNECNNASVILNLLRWRNAIVFIVPARAAMGAASKAVVWPSHASGQQGVKAYNFAMLV